MSELLDKIKHRINKANIAEQIIYINIVVFAISFMLESFKVPFFSNWFSLPALITEFISKPWTLITYGFLHGDFLHILFNLIMLFYFGNLFLDFFSKRDFLIYYFAGIIMGGALYLLSYNYFSIFNSNTSGGLVGASAGVMGILVGLATRIPNYAMHFRFIGAIKLWYIAAGLVLLDIIYIPISNTGGHIAHLGGALIGFVLTSQVNKGKNISAFFSSIFKTKKQKPLKTVYKKAKPGNTEKKDNAHQRKIDEILDKISKSGYEALSPEEKEFLFSIGKK